MITHIYEKQWIFSEINAIFFVFLPVNLNYRTWHKIMSFRLGNKEQKETDWALPYLSSLPVP